MTDLLNIVSEQGPFGVPVDRADPEIEWRPAQTLSEADKIVLEQVRSGSRSFAILESGAKLIVLKSIRTESEPFWDSAPHEGYTLFEIPFEYFNKNETSKVDTPTTRAANSLSNEIFGDERRRRINKWIVATVAALSIANIVFLFSIFTGVLLWYSIESRHQLDHSHLVEIANDIKQNSDTVISIKSDIKAVQEEIINLSGKNVSHE